MSKKLRIEFISSHVECEQGALVLFVLLGRQHWVEGNFIELNLDESLWTAKVNQPLI